MTKPQTVWLLYVSPGLKPDTAHKIVYGVYATQIGAERMRRTIKDRMATFPIEEHVIQS